MWEVRLGKDDAEPHLPAIRAEPFTILHRVSQRLRARACGGSAYLWEAYLTRRTGSADQHLDRLPDLGENPLQNIHQIILRKMCIPA